MSSVRHACQIGMALIFKAQLIRVTYNVGGGEGGEATQQQ